MAMRPLQRWRCTGSAAPGPTGGRRAQPLDPAADDLLVLAGDEPDPRLDEGGAAASQPATCGWDRQRPGGSSTGTGSG
jgi:hypothetical protein